MGYLQKLTLFLSSFKHSLLWSRIKLLGWPLSFTLSFIILHLFEDERAARGQQAQALRVSIKLARMRARREKRQVNASEVTEPQKSDLKIEKKEHSLQKSEHLHVAGSLIETYDMEIQCALETRSLDSRPPKEKEEDEKGIDLLLPREHKHKKKDDNKKEEAPKEIQGISILI
jgi:hypothetical protein